MTIEHGVPLAALARSARSKAKAHAERTFFLKCPVYGIEVAEAGTQVVVIIRARYAHALLIHVGRR